MRAEFAHNIKFWRLSKLFEFLVKGSKEMAHRYMADSIAHIVSIIALGALRSHKYALDGEGLQL